MTAHHYVVSQNKGCWHVSFHGINQGPFSTKQDAVDTAIAEARQSARPNVEVEVLVQDIESNFRSAWKSGDDGEDVPDMSNRA
ncbi:MAG TPA: hypothetical protein VGM83_17960 [Devosiaceae bacterium]